MLNKKKTRCDFKLSIREEPSVKRNNESLDISDMTARRYHQVGLTRISCSECMECWKTSFWFSISKWTLEYSKTRSSDCWKTRNRKVCWSFSRRRETQFLSIGTTARFFARELPIDNIRVVTNSLPCFHYLEWTKTDDLILIGGNYRGNHRCLMEP